MEKKRQLTELQKTSLLVKRDSKTTSMQVTDILKNPLAKVTIAVVVLYGTIIISKLFVKEISELVVVSKKLSNARKL